MPTTLPTRRTHLNHQVVLILKNESRQHEEVISQPAANSLMHLLLKQTGLHCGKRIVLTKESSACDWHRIIARICSLFRQGLSMFSFGVAGIV
mmetsp:Transcript_4523/g.9450  ORF Transcript_4523/g.9450 Transcript_4523/m.9450 type:complete len:93 (+) Transcript_4523:150-428(+)